MARVLVAALVAMIIAILSGPTFISFLRKNEFGQHIREELPGHRDKQGTPTMGGLLILIAASIAFIPLTDFTTPALTVFGTTIACGIVGFLDDYTKLHHQRSLGLRGRWKMVLLILISIAVGLAAHHQRLDHDVFVPIVDHYVPLGWGWYVLVFLIVAGAANGVNLTDGLDGLAAGTSIIALATFTAMAVVIFIRSPTAAHPARIENRLDIAFIGAALIGALIGFLWFNAFPAEVFMGDTGSMAIGGALAAMAIMMKVELLLVFVGGVFAVNAISVMLQVLSFKWLGKRIFLIAPLQHHFEMKAWSETKIMVRFWIVAAIFCAVGFALFYKYYPQIKPPPASHTQTL